MTGHVHSPAEWAAAGSLGLSAVGLIAFALAFADADFDPRPAVSRVVESGRVDPLLVAVAGARLSVRDAAISLAALLMLLNPAAPEATS